MKCADNLFVEFTIGHQTIDRGGRRLQANKLNRLKATAMGLAVIALLGFFYFTQAAVNLFALLIGNVDSKSLHPGYTLVLISLKPIIFLALVISAAGLYRFRRWGLYLANTAMAAYLATFGLSVFSESTHLTSGSLYQPHPHWPQFIKYSLSWDTLILPLSIVFFLILLNFTRLFDPNE